MSDLQTRFAAAADAVQELSSRPDNDTLLKLYAFYKQATTGDVSGKRPGMFDMVGRAKYDAWAKIQGMSTDEAMTGYIDLVDTLRT